MPGSPAIGYGCQTFPPAESNQNFFSKLEEIIHKNTASNRSSIEVSGSINSNTNWDVDTVKVVGDIVVENGVTLSIEPGVLIEFQDYYKLSILGRIIAIGVPDNFILFTTDEPELFSIDHSTEGCWNGIRFEDTPTTNEISKLKYCRIEYSKAAEENGIGGAISVYDFSKLEISDCIFQNNVADFGSAFGCTMHSSPKIISCLFKDNFAFIGGSPFYCSYSYPGITNNTIINNPVLNEEMFYATGAVHTFISKPQITNNIFWQNENNYFANQQLLECKDYYTTYNDIEFGHEGKGNIDEDPLFLNSVNYPFYLQENSPCIDAAKPDTTGLFLPEFDILGNDRIFDGEGNGEIIVDMGAFEYIEGFIGVNEIVMANPFTTLYNYPNPFKPSEAGRSSATTIYFETTNLHENSRIEIFNIKGQKVKQFSDIRGQHSVVWDGTDNSCNPVASGIYLAKLISGDIVQTRKMLLMK